MKNILIPSDFSASTREVVLYSLQLMKGRECNFYFQNPASLPASACRKTFSNPAKEDCINFACKHEAKILEKKVKKFFPEESFHFYALNSFGALHSLEGKLSLIVIDTELYKFNSGILNRQFEFPFSFKAPILFIPPKILFTPPRKVLLRLVPSIEVNPAILSPLKRLYGNHSFSLEIHKIFTEPVRNDVTQQIEDRLLELFDIYHPVIKFFNSKEHEDWNMIATQQKFDVQLQPMSSNVLKNKLSDIPYIGNLSQLAAPLLIIPAFEKQYPVNYRRSRKNRNTTHLQT